MTYPSQNIESWKKHFQNMSEGKLSKKGKLFLVGEQTGNGDKPVVELITPTQVAVEMARSKLKRKRKRNSNSARSNGKKIRRIGKSVSKKKKNRKTTNIKNSSKKNHSSKKLQKRRTR